MAKTRTPSPIPLTNDIYGTWKSLTIAAGLELDVFTLIAGGKRTAAAVAAAAGPVGGVGAPAPCSPNRVTRAGGILAPGISARRRDACVQEA